MSDSALKQDFDDLFMRINRRDRRIAELEVKLNAKHLEHHNQLSTASMIFRHYKMVKPGDKINTSFLLAVAKRVQELEAKLEGVNILIKDWEEDAEYDNELEQVIRELRKALLGKEPAPPPATDDGDSSAGGVGSDLNYKGAPVVFADMTIGDK